MIRVMVVARSTIVRAGLTALFTEPEIAVVGSVADLEGLRQQVEILHPDVVLVDEDVGDLTGWADQVLPPILLLETGRESESGGMDRFRKGIRGWLPKDAAAGEIRAAVEAIAAGLVVWHPDFTEALLSDVSNLTPDPTVSLAAPLTTREVEVLQMLAEGLGNKSIARRLGISEHTVKFHISSIFSKLQVSSRTEAVIVGTRSGLVLL